MTHRISSVGSFARTFVSSWRLPKKHAYGGRNLFELISDGNVSLMRAVEKFDYSRGFKFSTYASWAIIKNFARTIPAENTHRDRFVTGHELAFEMAPDERANAYEIEIQHERMTTAIDKILDRLDRSRAASHRFPLRTGKPCETGNARGSRHSVRRNQGTNPPNRGSSHQQIAAIRGGGQARRRLFELIAFGSPLNTSGEHTQDTVVHLTQREQPAVGCTFSMRRQV